MILDGDRWVIALIRQAEEVCFMFFVICLPFSGWSACTTNIDGKSGSYVKVSWWVLEVVKRASCAQFSKTIYSEVSANALFERQRIESIRPRCSRDADSVSSINMFTLLA